MRAPGLGNSFPLPSLLLLLLLVLPAFATAKQSKVSLRPKVRQQVKEQLTAPTAAQLSSAEEFDGLPGEVEYEVDLTDQQDKIGTSRQPASHPEATTIPEISWVVR